VKFLKPKGIAMPRTYPKNICLVILTLAISIAFANGESIADDTTIYKEITESQLLTLLQSEGINAEKFSEAIISVTLSGYPVYLKLDPTGTLLNFVSPVEGITSSLEKINAFNQTIDFGQAFLFEGTPMLQLQLNLKGGVSVANIKHYISQFARIRALFDSSLRN
jgi:hypothetical protein